MKNSEMNVCPCHVRTVKIGRHVSVGNSGAKLLVIAGPCVIESQEHCLMIAEKMQEMCAAADVQYIFKASYDKANRSGANAYRGPGLEKGLEILSAVREQMDVDILTDVHTQEQATRAAQVVDMIQIPAFLCRQTDMLIAAAKTGKPVNVKKGQFMAPWDMKNVCDKIESAGNSDMMLTERGASFGYNNLVCDPRSLAVMRSFGYPVMFDATHSVQLPGGQGTCSDGQRQFVYPLARSAAAVGVDALFFEVHNDPCKALCDGPNSMPLDMMPTLLRQIKAFYDLNQAQ